MKGWENRGSPQAWNFGSPNYMIPIINGIVRKNEFGEYKATIKRREEWD
jgi:hypothetical protein